MIEISRQCYKGKSQKSTKNSIYKSWAHSLKILTQVINNTHTPQLLKKRKEIALMSHLLKVKGGHQWTWSVQGHQHSFPLSSSP